MVGRGCQCRYWIGEQEGGVLHFQGAAVELWKAVVPHCGWSRTRSGIAVVGRIGWIGGRVLHWFGSGVLEGKSDPC